ncbi:unnamed protein product [Acanthoscelides obtectus]|uniref:Uncharacterized protein n=1 Tax=Acanthoscelides obtectus TaxID=200917 RepID=A0A9P0PEY2_ACAOB|nr:unnamed protein product [Acanthoscelides obtectus]CAK1657354.1 hypothetical protein AOBTE_LOCUS20302 [Acanthoscelides obtectus]
MRWDTHHLSPTIKDFDNKVSEADAYLQLMIDQTKVLLAIMTLVKLRT